MDMLKVLLPCCIPKTGDQKVHFLYMLHNPACQENVNILVLKRCRALIFHEKQAIGIS